MNFTEMSSNINVSDLTSKLDEILNFYRNNYSFPFQNKISRFLNEENKSFIDSPVCSEKKGKSKTVFKKQSTYLQNK